MAAQEVHHPAGVFAQPSALGGVVVDAHVRFHRIDFAQLARRDHRHGAADLRVEPVHIPHLERQMLTFQCVRQPVERGDVRRTGFIHIYGDTAVSEQLRSARGVFFGRLDCDGVQVHVQQLFHGVHRRAAVRSAAQPPGKCRVRFGNADQVELIGLFAHRRERRRGVIVPGADLRDADGFGIHHVCSFQCVPPRSTRSVSIRMPSRMDVKSAAAQPAASSTLRLSIARSYSRSYFSPYGISVSP